MHKVFIDTSAWISYCLSRQPAHSTINNLVKQLIKDNIIICISNDVIDETVTRLIYDTDMKTTQKFINLIKINSQTNRLVQLWVDEQVQAEAFEIAVKFAEHKLSLTDATTVVLMKRFNIDAVISLDADFKKVGIKTLP